MSMGLITKDIADSISDVDRKTSTIKGYASVFGNKDSDNDIIVQGSYAKTIQDWGPQGKSRIKHCWQHDITQPIAHTTELYEDSYGLAFVSTVPDNLKTDSIVQNRIALIEAGLVGEVSVGIVPVRSDWKNDTRYITEIKLYEYSSVTLASNELAKITSVKGTNSKDILKSLEKKSQAVMSLLKNGTVTDECFFMLEYYHKQLLKHISDLIAAPDNSTQQHHAPDDSTHDDKGEMIKSLTDLKSILQWN